MSMHLSMKNATSREAHYTSSFTLRRICSLPLLLAVLMLGYNPTGAQAAEATLSIPRVARPPELRDFVGDSRVAEGVTLGGFPGSDALGAAVQVTEFRQREPGDGVAVSQSTTAYLGYDHENLYVVFVCRDDPAKVRANITRREDIDNDDQVVVYLDTFHDRKRAYMFMINPRGIQRDGILTEGQDEDLSFDAIWTSEGRLTDDGYAVRAAIPFRSLRFSNSSQQTWGVALGRVIQRTNEEAYWPHITKQVKGFVPQFATLNGLTQISPGRNVQLNPYSVVARARVFDDDIPARVTQEEERIGLDAKVVVRDAVTLDATVNPDFSQVESDDPQPTVNERFEVFFPEKRPFFIENAGYFQTPVNLVFTRRIVDPGVGLRSTGKSGRWAFGAFAMNDRAAVEPDEPAAGLDAWVGAVRLQREIGKESTVGVLATNRTFESSSKFDRMFSADWRWRLGKTWALVGQVMRSEVREHDGARSSGRGAFGEVSREGRHFDYSGRYLELTPEFAAPLGFVSRVGFRQTEHESEYNFRPDGTVVSWGPKVATLFNWDHSTGRLQDREIDVAAQVELRGDTEIEIGRIEAFERFEELEFRPYANKVELSTEPLKWLGAELDFEWGTAVNHDPPDEVAPFLGRAVEAELTLKFRPTPRLSFDESFIHSSLRTKPGSVSVFTERRLRSRLNYQFSRSLSLRTIVDFQSEDANPALFDEDERDREWGIDLLLTYLVNPGTALYVGYTDEYENLMVPSGSPDVVRTRAPRFSVGRQVFLKGAYLWRF
jgi:hypothetical protein